MNKYETVKDYSLITISSLLMAIAVNFFFKEHMLAPGGITGASVVLNAMLNIPIEYVSFSVSIPLLVMGIIFLGKSFGIKTLYITVMTPVFLKIVPEIHVTDNLLLAAILGGVLVGSAIGVALIRDCTTGGTDLAAMLINKVVKFLKMPTILLVLDGTVIVASGVISGNLMISIYSLLSLMVIIGSIRFVTEKFQKKDSNEYTIKRVVEE